jgi:hypothetical protein
VHDIVALSSEAYDHGLAGDLVAVDRALAGLGGGAAGAEAIAWREALAGIAWFASASPSGPEPVRLASLALLGEEPPPVRDIAARACGHAVRACALRFDLRGLEHAAATLTRLAARPGATEAEAWRSIAAGWIAAATARPAADDLETATRHAARLARADLMLEATAVRALAACTIGDLDTALSAARRVSRMARTESLPQCEYLANLILARVRRIAGAPHLATRISGALLRVASAPWLPWLAWEHTLAHGHAAIALPAVPGAPIAIALQTMLAAARGGDVAVFEDALLRCRAEITSFAPLASDLAAVVVAVDPLASLDGAPLPLVEWTLGRAHPIPCGLLGLAGLEAAEDRPLAWVIAAPGREPRRVLAPGAAIARARWPVALEPPSTDAKQLRTDSGIAALALAGSEGLDEEALFRALYGFPYEPERHQSVRDVLYMRMRKRIAGATLERDRARVRLAHDDAPEASVLVPDPRCAPPAEHRILRVLAERRLAAAKDVAKALSIPLRTAQDALLKLAEDGAVRREKARVGLQYVLEDTTFSEPTRAAKR